MPLAIAARRRSTRVAAVSVTLAVVLAACGGGGPPSPAPTLFTGTNPPAGHEFAVRGSDNWGAEVFAFLTAAFGG